MHPSHWRKMTWTLLLFIAVIGVMVAVNSRGFSCGRLEQMTASGTGCQVTIDKQGVGILSLGMLGFIVLGVAWLMTRPSQPFPHICPTCGLPIKLGRTSCSKCGYVIPEGDMLTPDGQRIGSTGDPPS